MGTILLAGNGKLPVNIINALKKKKEKFFTLIISSSGWNKEIEKNNFKIVRFGKIVTELDKLKRKDFKNIIFAGNINRPVISEIKPDWKTLKLIPRFTKILIKGGDNFLFKFLISELQRMNFNVLSIKDVNPELFLGIGNITKIKPNKIYMNDIKRGKLILNTLSELDIGQSVVVQQGNVLGIEAIEGTDSLIKRIKNYKKKGSKPVLIKLAKKNQEFRADLPTIGPETINLCSRNGIGGIAYSAKKTIFIDHEKIKEIMDKKNMFLIGL